MSKLLTITEVLAQAQKLRASDIHIISGILVGGRGFRANFDY